MFGTVGGLVPNGFERYLRIQAPPGGHEDDDFWTNYRDLYEGIAAVGRRHTTTPTQAWFAVWDGHGWTTTTTEYEAEGLLGRQRFGWAPARQSESRRDDGRRNASLRNALREVPRFELPTGWADGARRVGVERLWWVIVGYS